MQDEGDLARFAHCLADRGQAEEAEASLVPRLGVGCFKLSMHGFRHYPAPALGGTCITASKPSNSRGIVVCYCTCSAVSLVKCWLTMDQGHICFRRAAVHPERVTSSFLRVVLGMCLQRSI